jgi:hypothetical protein
MVPSVLTFVDDLSKLSTSVIMIYMLALFIGFGLISNFIDSEGVIYNLSQGVFISVVTGGILYFARYLSRRRIANRVRLQPMAPNGA